MPKKLSDTRSVLKSLTEEQPAVDEKADATSAASPAPDVPAEGTWDENDIFLVNLKAGKDVVHQLCGTVSEYFVRTAAGGYWFGATCPRCRRDLVTEEAHFADPE